MDETERGDQGFGSSDITIDQRATGQKAKAHMEINEISARAFGQFYRRGETTGILRWDEIEDEIQLEAINISTELAIKNKKNKDNQDIRNMVPPQYHHLLDLDQENVGVWSKVGLNAPGPPRGVVGPVVHLVHSDRF